MKIRDVAELAAVLLGKQEIINTGIFTVSEPDEYAQEEIAANRELQLIIRCANLVAKEIACDYVPLLHTQKIVCGGGTVPYDAFDKTLLEIKTWKVWQNAVGGGVGGNVNYYTFSDYVEVQPGEYEVSYTFIPETKGFFDDTDYGGTKISDRILAYGTAAEFCLISGLYDDALIWERRYKDALMIASKKTNAVFLPRRRWW